MGHARRYRGWIISMGDYTGTTDDVFGRWYVDPPHTDYLDRRGRGYATLGEAKAAIREHLAEIAAEAAS